MEPEGLRTVIRQEQSHLEHRARSGDAGIDASMTVVQLDESAESTVAAAIGEQPWDVVVIGGGIRKPAPLLEFFEEVVNMERQHAPQAAIAFNAGGDDSLAAAKRWLAASVDE